MEWESVKDMLKKLTTATALVIVISTFAYFIIQYGIPDDAGVIRTSEGQFIYDKADSTIEPSAFFLFQRLDSTSFVAMQRDTTMELCNIVPIGTSFVSVRAIGKDTGPGGVAEIRIIKTDDSLYVEPWPPVDPIEPSTGYVFYFNEGTGDTTRSTGTLLCDGILSPGVSWTAEGVEFDGTGGIALQLIDTPSPDTLRISACINVTNFDVYDARIISKATGTSGADHWWMVGTFTDRSVRFRLKTDEGATTLVSEPNVLAIGQWHEVIAQYNGSAMWIIVDGEIVGSCQKTGQIASDGTVPVEIGDQPQGGRPFCGRIDRLEIK